CSSRPRRRSSRPRSVKPRSRSSTRPSTCARRSPASRGTSTCLAIPCARCRAASRRPGCRSGCRSSAGRSTRLPSCGSPTPTSVRPTGTRVGRPSALRRRRHRPHRPRRQPRLRRTRADGGLPRLLGGIEMDQSVEERLEALEGRLARIEALLERSAPDLTAATQSIRTWVTEYVSLRLQQLVPETCEHPPAPGVVGGPVLPGTTVRCTEDALDLHAFAPKDVASVVDDYLREAQRAGFREVRLIHGRGTGTQRATVRALLARHPLVAGFADAPPERGGWGATVVTLAPAGG